MPYIESKMSSVGFLPYDQHGDDPTERIIDEIDDQLNQDRFASALTVSEEALLSVAEENTERTRETSESEMSGPVSIATDSDAVSLQSLHSSSSEKDQIAHDLSASHLSTSTVRRKSNDDV